MGGAGIGVLLIVVGAVLYWAYDGNIPGFNDDMLGMILMVAGVATIILSMVMNAQRTRRRDVTTETRYVDRDGQDRRQTRRDTY